MLTGIIDVALEDFHYEVSCLLLLSCDVWDADVSDVISMPKLIGMDLDATCFFYIDEKCYLWWRYQ